MLHSLPCLLSSPTRTVYDSHLLYAIYISPATLPKAEPAEGRALPHSRSGTHAGFWSSQTLVQRLSKIISPFDSRKVKEACYRLSLGYEVYVTESLSATGHRLNSVKKLTEKQCFVIAPGHFALMITLESIRMPPDALGFLSIQTDVKFRGLVNISGFHVDPGSNGKITFSVFNAGPNPVHLRQGDPIFRLWIASLDAADDRSNQRSLPPNISIDAVNNISSPLESLQGLAKKVENIDNKLNRFLTVIGTAIAMLSIVAAAVGYFKYIRGNDVSSESNVSELSTHVESDLSPNAHRPSMPNPRAGVGSEGPLQTQTGTRVSP